MSQNIVSQKFEYDPYERDFGDGFYPYPVDSAPTDKSQVDSNGVAHIKFRKDGSYWVHTSNGPIFGLDGDYGIRTLEMLNKKYIDDRATTPACTGIKNLYGKVLYPK